VEEWSHIFGPRAPPCIPPHSAHSERELPVQCSIGRVGTWERGSVGPGWTSPILSSMIHHTVEARGMSQRPSLCLFLKINRMLPSPCSKHLEIRGVFSASRSDLPRDGGDHVMMSGCFRLTGPAEGGKSRGRAMGPLSPGKVKILKST